MMSRKTENMVMNSDVAPQGKRAILILSGVVILFMFTLSAWAWGQIPDGVQIPVHWGIDGQPDRYGGKFEGLFVVPIIAVATVALLYFVPTIDPRRTNIERSYRAYQITWAATILFLLLIHCALLLAALGTPIDIARVIAIGLGVLFLIIGNYMGKIRSNYMLGIRTPWTIASEISWNKTHRLGGKLFMFVGLLAILGGFVMETVMLFFVIIGGLIGVAIFLTAYSYLVWKNDPAMG